VAWLKKTAESVVSWRNVAYEVLVVFFKVVAWSDERAVKLLSEITFPKLLINFLIKSNLIMNNRKAI
jgi:hypothetical protein